MENLLGAETLKAIGFGGAIGFLSGFTLKRVFKLLAFILGLYILSLAWLVDLGIVSVNWVALERFALGFFSSLDSFARTFLSTVTFSGSFALGFAMGMKV